MVKPAAGDDVTLGEVYRAVQALETRMIAMNEERRHEASSMQSRLGAQGTAIALTELKVTELKREVGALKREGATHTGWLVGFFLAAATGLIEYVVHRVNR
jgi:hypothetical protein